VTQQIPYAALKRRFKHLPKVIADIAEHLMDEHPEHKARFERMFSEQHTETWAAFDQEAPDLGSEAFNIVTRLNIITVLSNIESYHSKDAPTVDDIKRAMIRIDEISNLVSRVDLLVSGIFHPVMNKHLAHIYDCRDFLESFLDHPLLASRKKSDCQLGLARTLGHELEHAGFTAKPALISKLLETVTDDAPFEEAVRSHLARNNRTQKP